MMNKTTFLSLLVFFFFWPAVLSAQKVTFPVTLDYDLLRSVVVSQAFDNDPSKEKILANDQYNCNQVAISDPHFGHADSLLRFEIKVRAKAGLAIFQDCRFPVTWEGHIVFFQTPVIDPDTLTLSFKTKDSILLNENREPEKITGTLWKLIKDNVHRHIDSIRIDLAPPVDEMKSFLAEMFPLKMRPEAQKMLDSVTPSDVSVQKAAVKVSVAAEIDSVYDIDRTSTPEKLSETEMTSFTKAWESMDAFMVHLITALPDGLLTGEEKEIIFETLLDTRYRFIRELQEPVHSKDFVRNQFIVAWDRLSVIFRNHLKKEDRSDSWLGYLAFFTSMDALKAIDAIGPAVGIDISRNGLIRLLRQISLTREPALYYSEEIDSDLRKTLGLEPVMERSKRPLHENNDSPGSGSAGEFLRNLSRFFTISAATAADTARENNDALEVWVPPEKNVLAFVEKTRKLLNAAGEKILEKGELATQHHDLFMMITDAVAWQESCFRQFRVKKGKIQYLRSYNNTSVGLMQINERVWRGIYSQDKLRWDIHYNADAGCEIIELYLKRYIFRKMKKQRYKELENDDNLARMLYALYNGGPGQFYKFLGRLEKDDFYLSDTLFFEKYRWVKNNQFDKVTICLVGR